ncbi:MAG: DinB family protein, partial [Kofleriaceae bacterium]
MRSRTLELCAPLTVEDQLVQPMADASPTKWHLAHTTWFFETIVLGAPDPEFNYLFNSYYEALGPRVERARRGMLSRPSLERVHAYRAGVDARMDEAIGRADPDLVELGLQHEQQHQELILTDAKYVLGTQPVRPQYRELSPARGSGSSGWRTFDAGVVEIGAAASGFAFDNERPRHRVFVERQSQVPLDPW